MNTTTNDRVIENWKRNIILFLGSQTVSLFGSSLVQYAIFWYITLEAKSGVMMTIYIICGFLPTFFLSPFAGVWADRYNRKVLIILSDSLIAISTLILALLFLSGYGSLMAVIGHFLSPRNRDRNSNACSWSHSSADGSGRHSLQR